MSEDRIPMNFCWKNYFSLAKELAEATEDEACLRSAISRAYYAAFCNARNHMARVFHNPMPGRDERNGMSAHTYLILYYKGVFLRGMIRAKKINVDPRKMSIGKDLDVMRIERERVDYDDYVDRLERIKSITEDVLIRSERVVSKTEPPAT